MGTEAGIKYVYTATGDQVVILDDIYAELFEEGSPAFQTCGAKPGEKVIGFFSQHEFGDKEYPVLGIKPKSWCITDKGNMVADFTNREQRRFIGFEVKSVIKLLNDRINVLEPSSKEGIRKRKGLKQTVDIMKKLCHEVNPEKK